MSTFPTMGEPLRINGFSLNIAKTLLKKDDREIHLTPKECKLMAVLMQNAGNVVSRKRLMEEIWETNYLGDTRTLDVHICWLRQKIEEQPTRPQHILTKRGQGYFLKV